ncbi:MAG: recombinase family protein [Defluviitaleaceae bacterium]|nr:recombinase family protein [Defluviitaleaceae bacterium]
MYPKINNPHNWNVALYARLSKEDRKEEKNGNSGLDNSESIANQMALLNEYAGRENLRVVGEYIDDGFSGGNYQRPGFESMIADIEEGKVNLVVTKDMSRLGRDYISTGHYIERYFPEMGVRYISLLDGIDTGADNSNNDITPFKAILNDLYAKDISKKIKATKHSKQEKGLFIGWRAPYGYIQSKENKNILEIDPEVADNVRYMFELAAQGKSVREIATIFNAAKIPTPATYKRIKLSEERVSPYRGLWSTERISAMLRHEVYIGNMVQRRMKKVSYKSKKCVRLPKEDWLIVEGTHDALVEQDVFKKVGLLIKSRDRLRQRTHEYLLKGLVYCFECENQLGVIMRKLAGDRETLYFVCRTYQRFTKENVCTCHCIRVETVTDAVMKKVKEICRRYISVLDIDGITAEVIQAMFEQRKRQKNSLANLKTGLDGIKSKIDRAYDDRLDDLIAEDDYQRIYKRLKAEEAEMQNKLADFDESEKSANDNGFGKKEVEELVRQFLEVKEISRDLAVSMIEKITLSESKEVNVHFRFKQHCKCLPCAYSLPRK